MSAAEVPINALSWKVAEFFYWLFLAALVAVKLVLVSDLSVQINFAPADDSLYVLRAFHLLSGSGYGDYDSNLLTKYPGISLWIAGVRGLGVPFLVSVNAVYIGAGLYLLSALRRGGASRWVLVASFALYLFNPITLGYEWLRVFREPLSTGILVAMVAAIGHVLASRQQGRYPWGHVAVFTVLFAFSLFVREDDRLLWGMLGLFLIALVWQRFVLGGRGLAAWGFIAVVVVLPGLAAKGYEHGLRAFAEAHYGLPIVHEFGEGEFPRLLAAIRGIHSAKENRMVMVTQEALEKLRQDVPSFRPVVERLPKPGAGTFSCQFHGVCSEWSNGWMPFWIKDEAYRAGLTPTLPAAQDYYRRVREDIERACAQGRLKCSSSGAGMIPPMELRWTKAYLVEGWRLLKWSLAPDISRIGAPPVVYDVPLELGRIYQVMTMADHYDTQLQAGFGAPDAVRRYASPLANLRDVIVAPYRLLTALLIVAAFAILLLRLWAPDRYTPGPLALMVMVFGVYTLFRLAVLSYVGVYMGQFSPRMVFSTNALAVVLALPFLENFWRTAWAARRAKAAQ